MSASTFRFAPSPNGRLHLGHAYSALLNDRLARAAGGRLLLRIEDIDPGRSRPDLVDAVLADLAWLGLRFAAPMHQSARMAAYRATLDSLAARDLVYPCFCSRSEVAAAARRAAGDGPVLRDPDGAPLYPGPCRHLSADAVAARLARGEPHTWRLAMDRALAAPPGPLGFSTFDPEGATGFVAADPARWGDTVIARRDVPASYHLAVVTDDAAQGITHVVRGADLLAATDLHVLLQALLGLTHPRYHHHALLLDATGAKLAKSRGSRSLADLRAEGVAAAAVRARLGFG
ncbi:tRNA glutamyl-Q(34) synthetase GluQRS [Methylobacterium sp. J-090]|uniref:tRNA glutamyl-Q(34) synthetase GluQRS n=1 Tax=Methylobacterium sp. J-090 TaxID=2836666 RepID=UPI001FBBD25B|nr:tRNA glutamyl-Q(34) synthetase GluQRS [Methylobacterium sp. J-090]MCJ2082705.1 tRNA glutamyl-Q(34) synthetase GluQRS [Methylobacterium sp. J-090]